MTVIEARQRYGLQAVWVRYGEPVLVVIDKPPKNGKVKILALRVDGSLTRHLVNLNKLY